jgi:23S rRNA (adenine2030-N6)-methyltransferase
LNYRHAFHAGNFADLVKHAALLHVLAKLTSAVGPLGVIDTHAGRGIYDLRGPEAQRSGEAEAGIARLMAGAPPAVFQPLRDAARALNAGGAVDRYPGSPWLISRALRPGDSYLACELRPDEYAALGAVLRGKPNVRAVLADGYAEAETQCPPRGRVLVLIDPPFERADDYPRIIETAQAVLRRNPQAHILAWLPLKDLETFDGFLRDLEDGVNAPILVAETRMRPLSDPMKMNGCALVLIGEDLGMDAPLGEICAWTAETLGAGGGARVYAV